MTVGLIFSITNGGTALDADISCGNLSNGSATSAQTIYVRHNGVSSITGVKFYIRTYTGSYVGASTAINDMAELIAWGDATTSLGWGGFLINQNAVGSFPVGNWPTVSSKAPTDGVCCRTGVADCSTYAASLSTATGATSSETIQAGTSPNVRFQAQVSVPANEDTVGIRQFELAFLYSYTS
jgi:hypothetical protein